MSIPTATVSPRISNFHHENFFWLSIKYFPNEAERDLRRSAFKKLTVQAGTLLNQEVQI
jgi:hypothetical protein